MKSISARARLRDYLAALTIGLLPGVAAAQAPAALVTQTPFRGTTYVAVATFTPATTPTDFLTITGSATRTVAVKRFTCYGSSTAAGSEIVNVIKRSTVDTGGTSTNPTAQALDSNNGAATAVVTAYTANPSALGTAVGPVAAGIIGTGPLTAAPVTPMSLTFGDMWTNDLLLRGTAQQAAINGASVSFTAGASITCAVVWTER